MKPLKNRQSVRFTHTRQAHQSELAEDYVEIMLELIEQGGDAHLVEVAKKLGVAHPTASKSLKNSVLKPRTNSPMSWLAINAADFMAIRFTPNFM